MTTTTQNLPNPFPISVTKAGSKGALIVFLLDKSGSMSSWTKDTIGGYNTFLNTQKALPDTSFTLGFFDTSFHYAFQNRPANVVYEMTEADYKPGGGTALMDAFGQTLHDTDSYLRGMKPEDRPTVIFVIMTDGEENSSHKFNNQQIKEFVSAATENGWAFNFLGANIDAFSAANAYGISASTVSNYAQTNTRSAYVATANLVSRQRSASVAGQSMGSASYSTEERASMGDK
jgi:Mg-chelatase subunit ChlD